MYCSNGVDEFGRRMRISQRAGSSAETDASQSELHWRCRSGPPSQCVDTHPNWAFQCCPAYSLLLFFVVGHVIAVIWRPRALASPLLVQERLQSMCRGSGIAVVCVPAAYYNHAGQRARSTDLSVKSYWIEIW